MPPGGGMIAAIWPYAATFPAGICRTISQTRSLNACKLGGETNRSAIFFLPDQRVAPQQVPVDACSRDHLRASSAYGRHGFKLSCRACPARARCIEALIFHARPHAICRNIARDEQLGAAVKISLDPGS